MRRDQQTIDTFDLVADLFWYPDKYWFEKLKILKELSPELEVPKLSLTQIQSFYITYFDLHSSKFATTPIASVWLDGKMMGKSSQDIEDFYMSCGYRFQREGVPDHLSNLLAFYAILNEEGRVEDAKEFKKWFAWLGDFQKSLNTLSEPIFSQLIVICKKLI